MNRDHSKMLSLAISAGFVLAACGGSDDEPGADAPAAGEVAADETDGGDEPAGGDDAGGDDAGGDDGGDDDGDEPAGDAGSSARDDAQQSLDDAGVDLDLEALEETIGNFSTGDGGGVVTIDGVAYTFEATGVCIWQGDDFVAEGAGQDPDGNPAWVAINVSVEDIDGDGVEGSAVDISVEPGRTELFGDSPDDAPDFTAAYWHGFHDPSAEIVYELSNGVVRGSGPVQDFTGIAIPFGEVGEMTFEASCT